MQDIHLAFTLFYPKRSCKVPLDYFQKLARLRVRNLLDQDYRADATVLTTMPNDVDSDFYFNLLPRRACTYYIIRSTKHAGSGLLQFLVNTDSSSRRWIYYDEDGHIILYRKDGLKFWLDKALEKAPDCTFSLAGSVTTGPPLSNYKKFYENYFDLSNVKTYVKNGEFGCLIRSDVQHECYRPFIPQRSLDGTFYLLQQEKAVFTDCRSRIGIHHDLTPGPTCIPLWRPGDERVLAIQASKVFDQNLFNQVSKFRETLKAEACEFFESVEVEKFIFENKSVRQVPFEMPEVLYTRD